MALALLLQPSGGGGANSQVVRLWPHPLHRRFAWLPVRLPPPPVQILQLHVLSAAICPATPAQLLVGVARDSQLLHASLAYGIFAASGGLSQEALRQVGCAACCACLQAPGPAGGCARTCCATRPWLASHCIGPWGQQALCAACACSPACHRTRPAPSHCVTTDGKPRAADPLRQPQPEHPGGRAGGQGAALGRLGWAKGLQALSQRRYAGD